ncbi:TRAP transporter substrate-binding protein [Marinihelvus fidelis]|uniref:TRAP transporter substrate-binding protein n=1 Tax=Marinihelvus fidelis TaxID=2613842 RepID=A0A5N0TJM5_9GAMM|nr:TRAP transporter substrate-binding protein [Marinihelvus fidelis]KAA9134116.1 TRAP transporter substrate-binding protein [Marinihelvus fidelis]
MRHSRFTLAGLVFLAGLLAGCARQDDVVVLKLAHALDTQHTVHLGMVHMAEQLHAYSGGTMRVDIYPSAQLGAERDLVELVQIGSLAMTKVSAAPLEAFVPSMKVFSIPYVFRDRGHYFRALDSAIGQELLDSVAIARLKGMGYYDSGSRSFYMVDTPVETPADIAGEKIRVMKSQTAVEMVAAMGGSATPISWGELYSALQQGVVDGAENNPPSFYLSGHYEVCKYYALNEHSAVPDILLMSEYVWESLDAQQQQWVQRAVDDSVAYQRELWNTATEEALAAVKAAGVTVTYPDKAPFMAAVQGMKASYDGTEVGRLIAALEGVE